MQWNTPGYEPLELSTQLVIGEALRRGHEVEVLDAAASFIRLRGRGKTEYVRQATRTSADTYVSPLIMENKKVTKQLLREAGIRVPDGKDYVDLAALVDDLPLWRARGAVIKPNSTNFGIGVSLLPAPVGEPDFKRAAAAAFEHDEVVLVEEPIPGREYRFLVIGDVVRAVLTREPAHVDGDGRHTIAELIQEKNGNPLRGKGYRTPLERIVLGAEERGYLEEQGLALTMIPAQGTRVYLRRNSNISTGGDSFDVTDVGHPGYRDLAVAAAAAVGARICGVDMIVGDLDAEPTDDRYAVIELNFNPALHIHDFPYSGENRRVERHVLDLLDL